MPRAQELDLHRDGIFEENSREGTPSRQVNAHLPKVEFFGLFPLRVSKHQPVRAGQQPVVAGQQPVIILRRRITSENHAF